MARRKKKPEERITMQIAPMIDCVFLMLIYFMVSASLKPQEADISFQLPGVVEQSDPLEIPDEQIIEITSAGQVIVNEFPYDTPGASRLPQLTAMLKSYKATSDANKSEATVTIAPHDDVPHFIIVTVMDACSSAGLKNVNFALGDEGL